MNGHVVGLGGGYLLPGEKCARIGALLKRAVRLIAANDGTAISDVADTIAGLEAAAEVHKQALRLAQAELKLKSAAGDGTSLDCSSAVGEPSVMTVSQAAGVLGVNETYVRRLAHTGRIRGTLDKRTWQLDAASVLAFRDARGSRHG